MQPQPPTFPDTGPPPVVLRPAKFPIIFLTATITTVIVSALWLLGIFGANYFLTENTPSFSVKISAPAKAEIGESILVQMDVNNPTDRTLTLSSIDLADTLLDGFKVTSVHPAASSDNSFGSTSYYFSEAISPGESHQVSFLMEATKAGVWTGDVDFTNPSLSFVTSSTTIRVDEPGAHPHVAEAEPTPAPFVFGIDTPHVVTHGENFTLRVNVTNPTDAPLPLDFIDFGGSLPEGLELQGVSPAPKHDERDEEVWSLGYSKSLQPGEKFAAEFQIKAVKEGIWTGDLDFWDEDSKKPASSSVTIRVNPAAAGTATPD